MKDVQRTYRGFVEAEHAQERKALVALAAQVLIAAAAVASGLMLGPAAAVLAAPAARAASLALGALALAATVASLATAVLCLARRPKSDYPSFITPEGAAAFESAEEYGSRFMAYDPDDDRDALVQAYAAARSAAAKARLAAASVACCAASAVLLPLLALSYACGL